jgi:hypothetical protein
MVNTPHDHARPDQAAMLAALDLAKAMLADDTPGIRRAAEAACPACVAVAALSFAFTATSELAGEETFNSGAVPRALAALVVQAERELRSAGN